jgi:hypothetical protein
MRYLYLYKDTASFSKMKAFGEKSITTDGG